MHNIYLEVQKFTTMFHFVKNPSANAGTSLSTFLSPSMYTQKYTNFPKLESIALCYTFLQLHRSDLLSKIS